MRCARLRCRLNGSEQTLDVHDDFYIGAAEDSDLRLSGAYAPRRAAILVRVDGAYRLYNTSPLVSVWDLGFVIGLSLVATGAAVDGVGAPHRLVERIASLQKFLPYLPTPIMLRATELIE